MPPIIKQSAPHILISMLVAPIMLTLFTWAGSTIVSNRDASVILPAVNKQLNEIKHLQELQDEKQNIILQSVYQNKQDIAVVKAIISKKG
ncbi:MAG TPA: hypothetical protein ENK68_03155 [Epsilonproteobacteria bacterium]|nr:hypothetical protein [Campylobacterota bacterium]